MAPTLLAAAVLAMALSTPINACNFHARRSTSFSNPHTGTVYKRAGEEIDFAYVDSFDWHTIKAEYKTCHSGVSQSPINLHTATGLAHTHTPDFAGWTTHGPTTGTFNNWGFGPAYTIDHDPASTDFTTLPAMTFDNTTVYLSGWHVHFPSEHLVDGVRSRAEMHMVSVTATGEPASVVSVRIEPNMMSESAFFKQMPTPLVGTSEADKGKEVPGVGMDPTLALHEVGGGHEYWTYGGSLTTPPCSEGLRWFVMARPLMVSQDQMVQMLDAGRFSARVEQSVWLQGVNQ